MGESILLTIKKLLGDGIEEDYTEYDTDIMIQVNAALQIIWQLGVRMKRTTIASRDDTWGDVFDDEHSAELSKNLIYMRSRLVFDPPNNSTVIESLKQSIAEYEWRLNVYAEGAFK